MTGSIRPLMGDFTMGASRASRCASPHTTHRASPRPLALNPDSARSYARPGVLAAGEISMYVVTVGWGR